MIERRKAVPVRAGRLLIGGDAPVVIQSMTNTDTRRTGETLAQVNSLAAGGCELVRVAVPDRRAASCLPEIVARSPVPIIADIHFNYELALAAIDAGVAKIRVNPGNMAADKIALIARRAAQEKIAMRIGVNAGSLEKEILDRYGGPVAGALVESALRHIEALEKIPFTQLVVSLKASDVLTTLQAYRMIAGKVPYPLHIGVTEAGAGLAGTVKSCLGIAPLLLEGIGDTLRVSLTGDPLQEVRVARYILQFLGLRTFGPEIISCPTCGRCEVDLPALVSEIEAQTSHIRTPLKIAVMGCAVNGPGEAREADIGICGGRGGGMLFKRGKPFKKVAADRLVDALLEELRNFERATK